MTTVILLRHGRSTANTGGVLAGWTPDVHLDETGQLQAQTAYDKSSYAANRDQQRMMLK